MHHESNSDNKEMIKKFNFVSKDRSESVEILIAELLVGMKDNQSHCTVESVIKYLIQGAYSFYTWPASKILAHFIFFMRKCMHSKKILEIGAGTSLPGILAAKLGAHVILSKNLNFYMALIMSKIYDSNY